MKTADIISFGVSLTSPLTVYAGMINAGHLSIFDIPCIGRLTINQLIWLLVFVSIIGIFLGTVLGSGASLKDTVAGLENVAQSALNLSNAQWTQKKEAVKATVISKLKDTIISLFIKTRSVHAVEISDIEDESLVPRKLLAELQKTAGSIKLINYAGASMETELLPLDAVEIEPQYYQYESTHWVRFGIFILLGAAGVLFLIISTWGVSL